MYNILCAYTKKKRLLWRLKRVASIFWAEQKELFIQERKKNKKRRILIPFWLGFSAKPHCIHRTLTQSLLYTNELPPLGYDTREMAAPKKKKGEDVKKERERESQSGAVTLCSLDTHTKRSPSPPGGLSQFEFSFVVSDISISLSSNKNTFEQRLTKYYALSFLEIRCRQ